MSCPNFREGIKAAGRLGQAFKFGIYRKYNPQMKPKIRGAKSSSQLTFGKFNVYFP
jgi:hypothetical protein